MKKQSFYLMSGLLALSLGGALLGCGGGEDGETEPTPTPTPTPTPGGANGRIVFQLGKNIYIMNGDGTGRTQVTNPTASDFDPDLSPDGTKIVFVRRTSLSDSKYQVMVVNADGTNERALTPGRGYTRMPRWSPDGSKIVYGASADSDEGIFTVRPDGTNETWFEAAGAGSLPDYSPDGSKIVFCSDRAGTGMDIYTINLDGTGLTRITNTPDYKEWNPRYSPDGTRLVCYSGDSPEKQVAVMNADGTNRVLIGPAIGRRPNWTPDGTKILFASPKESGSTVHNLFTINPDGSNLVNFTNASAHESNPSY